MMILMFIQPKPAIDVAPITEEYGAVGYTVCDMGCVWVESPTPSFPDMKLTRRTRFTCADKTRFLMTAEDGTKHCLVLGRP